MEGLADLGEELVEDLGEKLYVSKETKPLTKLRERERERAKAQTLCTAVGEIMKGK